MVLLTLVCLEPSLNIKGTKMNVFGHRAESLYFIQYLLPTKQTHLVVNNVCIGQTQLL